MTQERSAVLTPKFHLSKKNLGFIFTIVMSEIYSNGPVQVQIFDKIFRSWKRSVETVLRLKIYFLSHGLS